MKKIIVIVLTLFIIAVIFLIVSFISQPGIIKKSPQPSPTKASDEQPIKGSALSTLLIPTFPPERGGGVDERSPQVQASIQQIEKLLPLLTHQQIHTLSTQKLVEIIISPPDKSRPWVLPVFIGGIDYQVPEQSPLYEQTRQEFREAAQIVFDWINNNNADSAVIFVNWSDKAAIQERAEMWLQ